LPAMSCTVTNRVYWRPSLSFPRRLDTSWKLNENLPSDPTVAWPLGCTLPYSSRTWKLSGETTPERLSVAMPETWIVTLFPLGGQRLFGLAVSLSRGAV